MSPIPPTLGWRAAFDYTGLAGVLYAVPLILWLKDAPRPIVAEPAAPKPQSAWRRANS